MTRRPYLFTLAGGAILALCAVIVGMLAPPAVAVSQGDLFTDGQGQYICACYGSNCRPCAVQ